MTGRQLHTSIALLTAMLFAAPLSGAHGAPQALALLNTGGPVPLTCADGICKAEFSTYCLQQERDLPGAGVAYTVAQDGPVRLVLTGADGTIRTLPAAAHIRVTAARASHTAVVIEMPQASLAALGAQRAAIDVGDRVTLTPVPVAGDPNPQSEQDQHIAAGPLRTLGAKVVNPAGPAVATVRVLNRLVNALPEVIEIDRTAGKRMLRRALKDGFASAPSPQVTQASQEFAACWNTRHIEVGAYSVRNCLQRRHDGLMWDQVKRYWKAAGAGS